MFKVIYRVNITMMFLFVCFQSIAGAQIAPTNTATISGNVSDSSGKPVSNAKVTLSGPKYATTQTDAQGLFAFVGVPFGTYQISAAAAGLGTATRSVSVEGDTNVAIQYAPTNGLKVIAQVSSTANATFNVTPASVTQVSPIANAFEGKTSWRTILEQIPGIAQAGLGNGQLGNAALPDSPLVPMQISIDGALPYETATLLDGMPLIGGSLNAFAGCGTDLSVYPLNGFASADVVRGPGANAPSIVDSIGGSLVLHGAGVVNQSHYDFSLSTDPYGGIVANALAAVRWGKLSAVLTYGVNDSPGPLSSANLRYGTYPATVDGQSFSGPYMPPCPPSATCNFNNSALLNPNYAEYPEYGIQTGLLTCCSQNPSAWSVHSGSLSVNYMLSPSTSVGVFYSGQISSQTGCDYTVYGTSFEPPGGYTGVRSPGTYFLPLGPGPTQTPYAGQASSLVEEKVAARVGQGILRLAALQNRTFGMNPDSISGNTSTVQLFGGGCLGSATGMPNCPYGGTLTLFNGGAYNITCTTSQFTENRQSNNRDLSISYETQLGENLHAGASFVKSYYDDSYNESILNGTPPSFGDDLSIDSPSTSQTTNEFRFFIGGNPSAKTSLDLSTYFVTADYHVPNPNGGAANFSFIFSPYFQEFEGQPSAYTDARYSYTAPRLGFVWHPTPSIALRAAAGGGFAEAPLRSIVGSNGVPCPNNYTSPTSYSVNLENINLQPEKSFSFDLGTDIRLNRDTTLSFDVYRSDLYGQFYTSTTLAGTYNDGVHGTLPLYTTEAGNLGKSRYEGILAELHHDVPHGPYWAILGGLTRGYIVSLPAGFYNQPGQVCNVSTNVGCANQYVLPNINFNGTFAASVPYAQASGTLGYRWNAGKYVALDGVYYGNNNTYYRPAFVVLNGSVGYPISKNASLLMTFRNITGVYDSPVNVTTASSLTGAPTLAGPLFPLYGEQYGPRTIILTTNVSF